MDTKSVYVCQTCGHRSPKWRISCPNCKEAFPFVEESPEDFDEHGNKKPKQPPLLLVGKIITVAGVTIFAFALYALETKKRVALPVRHGSTPHTGKELVWMAVVTIFIGLVMLFIHYGSSNKKK